MQTQYETRGTDNHFMSDAEVLEAAADLVDDFLPLIEKLKLGNDILDESALPASRQSFESGFRLLIATTIHSARRLQLVTAGKLLAQFQPNVGRRIGLSPALNNTHQDEGNTVFVAQVEELFNRVDHDRERLAALFAEADAFARRRFGSVARPPFHEDGTYSWYGHHTAH